MTQMKAEILADAAAPERGGYAEQRLFDLSPVNMWITTAGLYALFVAVYALAASIDHVPWIVSNTVGAALDPRAWLALTLTLIVCCVLSLQRYSRLKEIQDAPAFARALRADVNWAPTFSPTRLRLFTAVGLLVGAVAVLFFLPVGHGPEPTGLAVFAWFAFISMLLSALFFRGLELTGAAARHTREVIRNGMQIDLLRIELLYPWGRAAARTSLVWFTVCAATLLIFVGSGPSIYTALLLVGCAGIGLWVFIGTLGLAHREIRAAKAAELETIRSELVAVKGQLDTDPAAPAKLQSLLAYEARIGGVPEWPFDQTILMRVGVSALILTVPWFGQAVAGLVVEHMGKLLP